MIYTELCSEAFIISSNITVMKIASYKGIETASKLTEP